MVAAAVACVLAVAGCVSLPASGPVLPFRPTQGSSGSGPQYLQSDTDPPGDGWSPVQIVQGFLAANASFAGQHQVAREYLTDNAAQSWNPGWSATVFSAVPSIRMESGGGKKDRTAVVTVSGAVQASVNQSGAYAVPSAAHGSQTTPINLKLSGGQWRISSAPPWLLLSSAAFAADYQSRNLYFFNPGKSSLVADPVYVPLDATRSDPKDLLTGLVHDLIAQPDDWLSNGATVTAFPAGTRLLDVTLDGGGNATVNLGGTAIARAGQGTLQQLTAQLLWTLTGPGNQPAVMTVALYQNGKPWILGRSGNPVQQQSSYSGYAPKTGAQSAFYYLDHDGDIWRQAGPTGRAVKVWTVPPDGPRLSDIAVSPDGMYLAGLSGGSVYTGKVGGRLARRLSGSYTSLSWDSSDQLWLTNSGGSIQVLHASSGALVPVNVMSSSPAGLPETEPVTALRVAPDGVRVAVVLQGSGLSVGAIIMQQSVITIVLSPFSVSGSHLAGVTWYGADDVIALSGGGAGAVATEYPVNGGTPTKIQAATGMVNITSSWGSALIATSANGDMSYDESVSGTWVPLTTNGESAAYPG